MWVADHSLLRHAFIKKSFSFTCCFLVHFECIIFCIPSSVTVTWVSVFIFILVFVLKSLIKSIGISVLLKIHFIVIEKLCVSSAINQYCFSKTEGKKSVSLYYHSMYGTTDLPQSKSAVSCYKAKVNKHSITPKKERLPMPTMKRRRFWVSLENWYIYLIFFECEMFEAYNKCTRPLISNFKKGYKNV